MLTIGFKTTVHEGPYNYIANWDYTKLATSFLHEPHARPHNLFAGDDVDKESDMPVWAEKIRTQADLLRALQRIERENDKLAFLECCVRPDDITPELQELGKKVSKGLA
jgi:pyruvate decarboxylase